MDRHILIVDNEEKARKLLRAVLLSRGYRITEASDGQEALEAIRRNRPDLVVLDIQMPVMDGTEVIRTIRGDSGLVGLKIIAITAFAMKGDRERILGTGADEYVSKPINTRELPLLIERMLG